MWHFYTRDIIRHVIGSYTWCCDMGKITVKNKISIENPQKKEKKYSTKKFPHEIQSKGRSGSEFRRQ